MNPTTFHYQHPLGTLTGHLSVKGLALLQLPQSAMPLDTTRETDDPRVKTLIAALDAYFTGEPQTFDAIPLDLSAGTSFQQMVWRTAMKIPWGNTSTYGALARLMGRPTAARAVGRALGANPVPILVPCHRFITTDGHLGGFSAGLDWKRALLAVEGLTYT